MFTPKSCGDIGVSRTSRTLGGVLAMWPLPTRKEGHRNPRSRPMSPMVSIGVLATVVELAPTDCECNKVAGVRSAALVALLVLH